MWLSDKKIRLICFIIFTLLAFNGCSYVIKKPQPIGSPTKQEVIDKHLKNKMSDPVHGIWITDDDLYEIAILKNSFGIYPEFQHIGVIVNSKKLNWYVGETKLLLKETAEPHVFIAKYFMKNKSQIGTTALQIDTNLLQLAIPQKYNLIRIYPMASKTTGGQEGISRAAGTGTGFFVRPNLVATNYHVVEGASKIMVHYNGGKALGEVVLQDPSNDLALIRIGLNTGAPLPLGGSMSVRQGQKIFTIGYPLSSALGREARVSEGIVNSTVGYQDDPTMFQISAPVQPGNSGGPLFNTKGEVVGIVTAGLGSKYYRHTGTMAQNVNFAVKIDYLNQLLKMLPGGSAFRSKYAAAKDAAGLFSQAKKSVVFIQTSK